MKKILLYFFCLSISAVNAQTGIWGVTSAGGQNNAGVIFRTDGSGNNYTVKESLFRFDGDFPLSNLMQASNGKLYGMTSSCCVFDAFGVLFEYDPVTATYTKKYSFNDTIHGSNPYGALIQANDGKLYGMTAKGGIANEGTLFQYDPASNVLTKKLDFESAVNGSFPEGSLLQAANGKLYGMTATGGANDYGTLFEYDLTTSACTKLFDFNGSGNGSNPHGSLIQAGNGKLYGMTSSGGTADLGVLFQYDLATAAYAKKIDFNGAANGSNPFGSLLRATDGYLYGLTSSGGTYNFGVLFQFDPATAACHVKLNFKDSLHGNGPQSSLIQATDGKFYGTTQFGGNYDNGVIFQYDPVTSVYSKKVEFDTDTKGQSPVGALMQATNGILYGMTYDGGDYHAGVLYQYNAATNNYVKEFDFHFAQNGSTPACALMQAADKMLYGVTKDGGANGDGTIFQYDPYSFTYKKKFDFDQLTTGSAPSSSLMQATDGKLYGVTSYGGNNDKGVFFQYDPVTAVFTKKITFDGLLTGAMPCGELMQASDGNIYGMTYEGGSNDYGVIYQYNPATGILSKKFDFDSLSGKNPIGGLTEAADGKFYGMTSSGGTGSSPESPDGLGVLFQYNPANAACIKKIDFNGAANGSFPAGTLIKAADGTLYGLTSKGGIYDAAGAAFGCGVLFQYNTATNTLTKKFDFNGNKNGSSPSGHLLAAANGKFYGRTQAGGNYNQGVLFEFNPATAEFIKKTDFSEAIGKIPNYGGLIEIALTNSVAANKTKNFQVFPNPGNAQISIKLSEPVSGAAIKLVTVTGQTVLEKTNLAGDLFVLNIASQANGLYFIELVEKGIVSRIKLIKN